jgi:hypothetical protein
MIMRLRHANIRLINRRSKLLWLLLALSSKNGKNNPIDVQALTGSLHIRFEPMDGRQSQERLSKPFLLHTPSLKGSLPD